MYLNMYISVSLAVVAFVSCGYMNILVAAVHFCLEWHNANTNANANALDLFLVLGFALLQLSAECKLLTPKPRQTHMCARKRDAETRTVQFRLQTVAFILIICC